VEVERRSARIVASAKSIDWKAPPVKRFGRDCFNFSDQQDACAVSSSVSVEDCKN
jgi:hypothetical protein